MELYLVALFVVFIILLISFILSRSMKHSEQDDVSSNTEAITASVNEPKDDSDYIENVPEDVSEIAEQSVEDNSMQIEEAISEDEMEQLLEENNAHMEMNDNLSVTEDSITLGEYEQTETTIQEIDGQEASDDEDELQWINRPSPSPIEEEQDTTIEDSLLQEERVDEDIDDIDHFLRSRQALFSELDRNDDNSAQSAIDEQIDATALADEAESSELLSDRLEVLGEVLDEKDLLVAVESKTDIAEESEEKDHNEIDQIDEITAIDELTIVDTNEEAVNETEPFDDIAEIDVIEEIPFLSDVEPSDENIDEQEPLATTIDADIMDAIPTISEEELSPINAEEDLTESINNDNDKIRLNDIKSSQEDKDSPHSTNEEDEQMLEDESDYYTLQFSDEEKRTKE